MKKSLLKLSLGLAAIAFGFSSSAQTYTFTNCGATGRFGPTQGQVNATYTGPNTLTGAVTINTQGIQEWTVPFSGTYNISAAGAQGGSSQDATSKFGAIISGDVVLTAGQVVKIAVGQMGSVGRTNTTKSCAGGGGGSFVTTSTNTPLMLSLIHI